MEGFFSAALGGIFARTEVWTGKKNGFEKWCMEVVDVGAQDNFGVG